jgi:hypothetical protein
MLPGPITARRGTSWVLGDRFTGDQLTRLVVSLHVAGGIAILASAVAIAFAPSVPGWWRPLAITGAVIGLVAFAVFWDGQTHLLFEEGAIGAVVSLLLLVGTIAFGRPIAQP